MDELRTPIAIIGGGCGGVSAALAIARNGGSCIVTEPTDWVGGQLTSQAVPPDENRWIEGLEGVVGGNRSYLQFRRDVRAYYRNTRGLTPAAVENDRLNPGNGWVSHLCMEPRVAHAVLEGYLAPHVSVGRVRLLTHAVPVSAEVGGDRLRSVVVRDTRTGDQTCIVADYFLDATELGDLYPLAGIEHLVGAEHRDDFGEMHGRADRSDSLDQQAISWCFAIEHRPGENHVIDRPANYAFWRDFVPKLDHVWPGKLFSWTVVGGDEHHPVEFRFVPWPDEPRAGEWEMWRYRRIVDRSIYADAGTAPPDVSLINMVQMDYFLKPLLGVSDVEQAAALAGAREQSLCFFHWMQTDAPRHDGGTGYPGLRLRGDELGTADGFAKAPYIREPRRLRARTVVHEGHFGTEQRSAEGKSRADHPHGGAEIFADSVGLGHYRLDLHPSTAMRGSLYVDCAPFRVPMGALIPQRVRNLLAAGKGIGVTHIANGAYRMHPTEWTSGEAAGLLALHCLRAHAEPLQVHENPAAVLEFQETLRRQGVALRWAWEPE